MRYATAEVDCQMINDRGTVKIPRFLLFLLMGFILQKNFNDQYNDLTAFERHHETLFIKESSCETIH